jgi:hypothetical protein
LSQPSSPCDHGTAYVVRLALALVAFDAIVVLIAHAAAASSCGKPATCVLLGLVLGVAVLLVADGR